MWYRTKNDRRIKVICILKRTSVQNVTVMIVDPINRQVAFEFLFNYTDSHPAKDVSEIM